MTRSIRRPFLNTPEGCRVLCAPCKVCFLPCSAELLSLRRRSVADLLLAAALLCALLGWGLLRGLLRGALLRGGLFRAALCCFLSCHSLLSAPFLVSCPRPQDTVANFSLWPRVNGAQHVGFINTMRRDVNTFVFGREQNFPREKNFLSLTESATSMRPLACERSERGDEVNSRVSV